MIENRRLSAWCSCLAPILLLVAVFSQLDSEGMAAEEEKKKDDKAEKEKGKEKEPAYDLKAWGKLVSPLKKSPGFYNFTYYQQKGRSLKSVKAFLKLPEDLKPLVDKQILAKNLREGEEIFVLGKPVSRTHQNPYGAALVEHNIAGCQAILAGRDVKVDLKYRDRRDSEIKWCKGKYVSSLKLNYDKQEYKLLMGRSTPVIMRQEGTPENIKKGAYIFVLGRKIDERPETTSRSDAKKETFEGEKVVVLVSKYVKSVYQTVFESSPKP